MRRKAPEVIARWQDCAIVRVPGKFSNLYLVLSGNSVVMIDAGLPSDVRMALSFVGDELKMHLRDLKVVVPTHLHIDHVAGVTYAAARTGAGIAMGRGSKPYLNGRRIPAISLRQWLCTLVPYYFKLGAPLPNRFDLRNSCITGLPCMKSHMEPPVSLWLDDNESIPYLDGWRVLCTPGHTPDHICVLNEQEGILISGDMILNFSGCGEFNNLVCDEASMEESIARIRRLHLRGILPGHGDPLWGKDLTKGITRARCSLRR